jgi:hypothetical protein
MSAPRPAMRPAPSSPEASYRAFLEAVPPPWTARALSTLLLLLAGAGLAAATTVQVEDRVRAPFVLLAGPDGMVAEVAVSQRAMAAVRPGLPVRLRLDAYPAQRYGTLGGRVVSVAPRPAGAPTRVGRPEDFVATIVLDDSSRAAAQPRGMLRPMLTGEADVVVGRRSLLRAATPLLPAERAGRAGR